MNKFLESVEGFNEQFSSIEMNGNLDALAHTFWSILEIERARHIQAEWEVPSCLIPFYGDWHDLFCFDLGREKIVFLNDDRKIIYTWSSIDEFVSSLSEKEVEPPKKPKLVSHRLSSDLLEKAIEFKRKHT